MTDEWPLPAFHFSVVIDNNQDESAFQEITGIESRIETEEFQEGGNNLVYYLPKSVKYNHLSLKRGIANSQSTLVKWCQTIFNSQLYSPIKSNVLSVRLLDHTGSPCRVWVFYNAYPISWKVDAFHATKNEVAIEEIELCFSRARRAK